VLVWALFAIAGSVVFVWALKDGERYSKAQVNAAVTAATRPLEAKNADLASKIRDLEGEKADLEERNNEKERELEKRNSEKRNDDSAHGVTRSPVASFRPLDSICNCWANVESRLRVVDRQREAMLLESLKDSLQHHLSLIYLDRTRRQAEIRYTTLRDLFGHPEIRSDRMALQVELLGRLLHEGSRPFFLDSSFQAHLVPPEELARLLADMDAQRGFQERTCLRDFGFSGYEHWVTER
jgi:hypothetical protein